MSNQKQQKPTLTGQRFKTRKRGEKLHRPFQKTDKQTNTHKLRTGSLPRFHDAGLKCGFIAEFVSSVIHMHLEV